MHSSFQEVPWPPIRELVVDYLTVGSAVRAAHGMMEVDVSRPLALIDQYKSQVSEGVSFTAYLAYCFARAIDQHKIMHAYRKGRKRLIIFNEVDVNTLLEKQKPDGTFVPVAYIIRAANLKSFAQINHELREASRSDLRNDEGVRRRAQLLRLPTFIRRFLFRQVVRNPMLLKQQWGTVGLSNVGSFISPRPSWGISISFMTCVLIVGGMFDKVYWNNGQVEPRKTMTITVSVNHDIIDGGPGVRFGDTFARILEGAEGLGKDFLTEAQLLSGNSHA